MIQGPPKIGFLSGRSLGGIGEQRLWIAFTLRFAAPEIRKIHEAALPKDWKDCSVEELNVHLIYFHLQPSTALSLGIAKYDIDAAAVRKIYAGELVLDDFVEAIYVLLEFSPEMVDLDVPMDPSHDISEFVTAHYRKILVKNLKYLEYIEREKGVRLLNRPVQWDLVSRFVPDWASIQVDPKKDCRDSGKSPFQEEAEAAAEASRRFKAITQP